GDVLLATTHQGSGGAGGRRLSATSGLKRLASMRAPGAGVREVQLIRHLYTRGWTREQILDLFRFLDGVLTLPEALEQQFQVALAQVEAETHMPYITSIERM